MGIELGKTIGKINLTNVTGNIELNNTNNNIELDTEKENIELNGISGDIKLVVPQGGSDVEIDPTLTKDGAAADAKATGEAINEVKEKTELLMEDYIGAFPISIHPNSTYNTKYDYVNVLTLPDGKYAINKHTKTVILGATADDGTVKTITLFPINNSVVKVSRNNAYVFISSDDWDYRWRIALADTSTSSKIVVDRILNLYLGVTNIVEYTPTENYHPATKKYVDDNSTKIDATLSVEGAAADAKATGDMFRNYNAYAEITSKEILVDANSTGYAVHDGALGLIVGETYYVDRYLDGELFESYEIPCEEDWYGKGTGSLYATVLGDADNEIYVDFVLTDGVALNPAEAIEEYGDYYSIENWLQDDSVAEFEVCITGKFLSKVPLESMYIVDSVLNDVPFPVTSDAVAKEMAALDKKVAYVVQTISAKNGANEILLPETKNYNRAEVRMGMFVNGKQDIYYNPNKNHLSGNGDYGFISEEGFSTFGICLTPDELKGTEGNYYAVIDIQLLTMTSTSGAVHCKIDSTFYKYADDITSIKTERNVEDFKPYKKSIDTMYFFYGRSSFSSINRGFIYIDDGANTVFNGTTGKITYYQK